MITFLFGVVVCYLLSPPEVGGSDVLNRVYLFVNRITKRVTDEFLWNLGSERLWTREELILEVTCVSSDTLLISLWHGRVMCSTECCLVYNLLVCLAAGLIKSFGWIFVKFVEWGDHQSGSRLLDFGSYLKPHLLKNTFSYRYWTSDHAPQATYKKYTRCVRMIY